MVGRLRRPVLDTRRNPSGSGRGPAERTTGRRCPTARSRAWSTFQATKTPPRTLRRRPLSLYSPPDAATRASGAEEGKFQKPLTRLPSRRCRARFLWPGIPLNDRNAGETWLARLGPEVEHLPRLA